MLLEYGALCEWFVVAGSMFFHTQCTYLLVVSGRGFPPTPSSRLNSAVIFSRSLV